MTRKHVCLEFPGPYIEREIAIALLGISEREFLYLLAKHTLQVRRIGKQLFVHRDSIIDLLRSEKKI